MEASAFVLRRNWLLLGGALAALAAALIATRTTAFAPEGWVGTCITGLLVVIFGARNAFPRETPGKVHATSTGITVEGFAELRSEDVLEAKVLPRRGIDAIVVLALRGRVQGSKTLSLRMHERHAKALVDVLGARRSRFRLVVPFARRFFGVFVVLAALTAFTTPSLGLWAAVQPGNLLWSWLFAWLLGFVRGGLVVGADGFATRWLFRRRFVPFRDVAKVEGRGRFGNAGVQDTVVQLASGRTLRLRTVEAPNTEAERGAESRAMLAHVKEAFERSARSALAGAVDVHVLVSRGSRSAEEWLSGLDALVRGGGSRYRVAAVSPEMLAELAEDPSASFESRAGAAAALVRIDDEALRTRLRISAEACAEPDLRGVLLALSDARDDETTLGALAAVKHQARRAP